MRKVSILGMSAAVLAATSLIVTRKYEEQGSLSYPLEGDVKAPDDIGPVTDSTREGKRAKRRRLANIGRPR